MAGEGAPVVVTDAQASWAAARTWSFEHLARTYGGDPLIASDKAPLRLEDSPRAVALRTTMAECVRYVLRPEGTALAARELVLEALSQLEAERKYGRASPTAMERHESYLEDTLTCGFSSQRKTSMGAFESRSAASLQFRDGDKPRR